MMIVTRIRPIMSEHPDAPPQEEVSEYGMDEGVIHNKRTYRRGVLMGCLTEREAQREQERQKRNEREQREATVLAEAMAALTPRQDQIRTLLSDLVDALGRAGVDVSYFPHAAEMALCEYAKTLEGVI